MFESSRMAGIRALALCLILAAASAARAELPVSVEKIESAAVGRTLKYCVALPKDYEGGDKKYPVLYLLHGLTSNYLSWPRLGAALYAEPLELIVVMPDAGNTWYVNWAKPAPGAKEAWEDFILKDLIPHIDGKYRTIAERKGRAISGLSMGGFGAIAIGLRHPEMFCSIASHSGALGFAKQFRGGPEGKAREWEHGREDKTEEDPAIGIPGFNSQAQRTPGGRIFDVEADIDAFDPFTLILKTLPEKLPHIYLDCGTEDGLVFTARDFAKILQENGIEYTYAEAPGRHTPPYWFKMLAQSMAVQYQVMQREIHGYEMRQTVKPPKQAEETKPAAEAPRPRPVVPRNWPPYEKDIAGENPIRLINPNAFPVLVGLRSGPLGLDIVLAPGEDKTVRAGDGKFKIMFQYATELDRYYDGDDFELKGHGVEITLME